jgi:drug/metabolite transporter (DMT)-like permease
VKEPWSRGQFVRLAVIVGLGVLVCALAWNGTSTRITLEDQTPWIAFGIAGLLLAAVAQLVWLRQGRRAVAVHGAQVQASVASLIQHRVAAPAQPGSVAGLVAAEGMAHFHRPECPIAAGRPWQPEPRRVHEAAGRTPCGICTP